MRRVLKDTKQSCVRFNLTNAAYLFIGLGFLIVYCRELTIPLMHNDSAHHANIAMHMYHSGDYISLIDRGSDYIDKPHFLFWTAALAYHVFGVTPFAYKFTTFLFGVLCLYSTYRIAHFIYDASTAGLSVLILISSYSFMLSFNDVRMDAILAATVTFSIWQMLMLNRTASAHYVVGTALGLALGFSVKGLLGIVVPAVALTVYLISIRTLKELLSPKWILAGLCTVIFILPVLYCYYIQFDLHPEKNIHGATGVSGVKFILLGQTFQRLSGSEGMPSSTDPLFYLHTFLWAFLPWSLLAFVGWWKELSSALRNGVVTAGFFLSITTTFVFLILSIASSKLPHYLNVILPLISITTAGYLRTLELSSWKRVLIIQNIVAVTILILVGILSFYLLPVNGLILAMTLSLLAILLWCMFTKRFIISDRSIIITVMASLLLFFTLNFQVFPEVMNYQAGEKLATMVKEKHIADGNLYFLQGFETCNDFDFALQRNVPLITAEDLTMNHRNIVIITGKHGVERLKDSGYRFKVIGQAENYRVSRLNFKFLDRRSRQLQLDHMSLLQIY